MPMHIKWIIHSETWVEEIKLKDHEVAALKQIESP